MPGQSVKVAPLFFLGGGALLLWSGLTGKKWSTVLKDLIKGQNPSTAPKANPITSPVSAYGYGGGAPGAGQSAKAFSLSGASQTDWSVAFLHAIGAPATNANIISVNSWQSREGGGGQNNPLNTTLNCCGAIGNFNSVGVKNYPTPADGVRANANTLLGGGYSDVLLALRSGRGLCGQSFAGLSRWSGGGYSSVC